MVVQRRFVDDSCDGSTKAPVMPMAPFGLCGLVIHSHWAVTATRPPRRPRGAEVAEGAKRNGAAAVWIGTPAGKPVVRLGSSTIFSPHAACSAWNLFLMAAGLALVSIIFEWLTLKQLPGVLHQLSSVIRLFSCGFVLDGCRSVRCGFWITEGLGPMTLRWIH